VADNQMSQASQATQPTQTTAARRIRAGGVSLAVTELGADGGVPVMVLHGFTGSAQAMEPLTGWLAARLQARLICPDLVGHGLSEAPEDLTLYTVEAMVKQITDLADTLECETFHLVGYSMGGRVALTLGCTEVSRLRSLTLIGASSGIADTDQRIKRQQADTQRAQRLLGDFEAFVDEWMAQPLFASQAALGEEHCREARQQRLASKPEGLARSLIAAGTGAMVPLDEQLGRCEVPTLLVVGVHDTKFCAIAEQLEAGLSQAQITRIASAGHAAHLEQPDTTATVIERFIASTDTSASSRENTRSAAGQR